VTLMGWNENFERKTKNTAGSSRLAIAASACESDVHAMVDLLSELHVLLEEYAPAWYGQDLHDRIDGALRSAGTR